MPDIAELQQRLTAARAENERLQQARIDLQREQAAHHETRAALDKAKQTIRELRETAAIGNAADAAGAAAEISGLKERIGAANEEKRAALAACSEKDDEISKLKLSLSLEKSKPAEVVTQKCPDDCQALKEQVAFLTADNDRLKREAEAEWQ